MRTFCSRNACEHTKSVQIKHKDIYQRQIACASFIMCAAKQKSQRKKQSERKSINHQIILIEKRQGKKNENPKNNRHNQRNNGKDLRTKITDVFALLHKQFFFVFMKINQIVQRFRKEHYVQYITKYADC